MANTTDALPDPLTPPDCDLNDYTWMPIDVRRLLTSETWVLGTGEGKAAAMTLWLASWHERPAASLPDNDRMLAHLSMAGAGWKKVRAEALRGWVKCSDGRLYHPVVAEKAREAWALKLAQKQRTEAARRAKAERSGGKPTGNSGCPVADPVTTSDTEAVAASVTEAVTGSNRTEQTRTDQNRPSTETSSLPSEPAPASPPSLWVQGLALLRQLTGRPEAACRAMIGRWRKALGDDDALLLGLLIEVQAVNPADPVPWIEKAVALRTGRAKPAARQSNSAWMADELRAQASLDDEPFTIDGTFSAEVH